MISSQAKTLLFLTALIASTTLTAQYTMIRVMDQWKQKISMKDLSYDPLMADAAAKISTESDEGRIEYLNQSIRPVVIDRYLDIFGDPYLNKKFSQAKLMDAGNQQVPLAPVNYNAFSSRLEFKQGDSQFQFLPNYSPRAILTNAQGQEELLVYGLLPGLESNYSTLLLNGNLFKVATNLSVGKAKNEGFAGSGHSAKERFTPVKSLYLWHRGRWVRSGFKVKTIAKEIGWEKEIKAFVKKNKLNLKDNTDLLQLMTYVNELIENNQ